QLIQQRVALPGDSDTRRAQKSLAVIVLIVAAISTGANGLRYYGAGLADVAAVYGGLTAVSLIGLIVLLAAPQVYVPLAFFMLLSSYVGNGSAHLLAGGYTSGLQIIQWGVAILVFAVLFVERRLVLVLLGLFILMVMIAGMLESSVRSRLPDLDPQFVATDSTITLIIMGALLTGAALYLFDQVERYRSRADDLLLNILPGTIAGRLKENPGIIADGFSEATVLFADIVDFTTMSSGADPADVVRKLNEIFSDFDRLAIRHGLEKIKTIGDAYMVAGGLPEAQPDHCQVVAAFALDMVAAMERHRSWTGEAMRIRVGINTGPVVAGVIGQQKFIYDLWGDAVNVASRMESNGLSNEIQVTQAVKDKLAGLYEFEERGPIYVKGKGEMVTYLMRQCGAVTSDQWPVTTEQ
ncbi:MAG: adenylate/guanylate cyclase domain-containing protein, partial [Candidatus Promineifilaceae bacterium]